VGYSEVPEAGLKERICSGIEDDGEIGIPMASKMREEAKWTDQSKLPYHRETTDSRTSFLSANCKKRHRIHQS
jgi:hypothetical protein